MIEFLCANGHSHETLLDFSIEKVRDLFADAQARQARDLSILELAMMNAVATGAGAVVSKKGVQLFNRTQKRLLAVVNGEKQDVRTNVKRLAQNLLSIGALPSYADKK